MKNVLLTILFFVKVHVVKDFFIGKPINHQQFQAPFS